MGGQPRKAPAPAPRLEVVMQTEVSQSSERPDDGGADCSHSARSHSAVRSHVKGLTGVYRRETRAGEVRYEVAFTDNDGRQRWRTVGSLREAKALRADLSSKVNRGETVASSRATVAEYAAERLAGRHGSGHQTHRNRPKPRGSKRAESGSTARVSSPTETGRDSVRYLIIRWSLVRIQAGPFRIATLPASEQRGGGLQRESNVLVSQVDESQCRLEGVPGELRLGRTERAAVERLSERRVDLVGIALDPGPM
jgi:hypothetical protein